MTESELKKLVCMMSTLLICQYKNWSPENAVKAAMRIMTAVDQRLAEGREQG